LTTVMIATHLPSSKNVSMRTLYRYIIGDV